MDNVRKLLRSKVAQNGMWLLILQMFNMVVPLLTLPYITRILSTSDYGKFSIALNWIGYLQVIVEFGFGLTGARKVAATDSKEQLSKIHCSIIYARFLLAVFCATILAVICIMSPVEKSQIVCMLILFLMVVAVIFQQTWFFQGISEMRNITVINMISRAISVALIFLLVRRESDLYLYCFLYVSNFLIASLFGMIVVHKKYKVKFCYISFKCVIEEIKDGWYLFISSAMSKIFSSIGITVLGFVAISSEVGIYSAINKIPYIMTILFASVSQALYPHMCKQFTVSFDNGLKQVRRIAKLVMMPFIIVGIIFILLNKPIVLIAFGSEYAKKSTLLIPFVIWVLFSILNNFLGVQTLVASESQKEYSQSFQISTVIMLVLMFLLGRVWGSYGVAGASMLSEMILTVLLLINISVKIKKENKNVQETD